MGGLKEFLSTDDGHGFGSGHSDGCGHGDGDGSGYGDGSGHGRGDGCGHGHGYCGGYGYGDGSGHGDGDVSGKGTGSGSGYGDGADSKYNCGIKSINGFPVYVIDGVYTVIYQLHGDIAKGAILHNDLSLQPCYVVKHDGVFGHGCTLHEAQDSLMIKLFDNLPESARIEEFCKQFKDIDAVYPVRTFFVWHHRLTGSCEAGRKSFAKDHELDIENDFMSVREFLNLTKNAYRGSTIRKVLKRLEGMH